MRGKEQKTEEQEGRKQLPPLRTSNEMGRQTLPVWV